MDADALPEPLVGTDVRLAVEVLKMVTRDEMERELYEGRLKARLDLQTRETERRIALEKLDEANRRLDEVIRQRDQAQREVRELLAERIQLSERLLGRPVSRFEDLTCRDLDDLRRTADGLERELPESGA